MKTLFITATGTDIGKTYITAQLVKSALEQNKNILALKPIISAFNDNDFLDSDSAKILSALNLELTTTNINSVSPYRFKAALSPEMAARLEGKTIAYNEVLEFCRLHITEKKYDLLLIEGVGGAFGPICNTHTNADLISDLAIPCLLITGSYLGAMTHAIATYNALIAKKIKINSVIINESKNSTVDFDDTYQSLKEFIAAPLVKVRQNQKIDLNVMTL